MDRVCQFQFAGADYKDDTIGAAVVLQLIQYRHKRFIIHEVHFTITRIDIKLLGGGKLACLAEPSVGIIFQGDEANDIGHIEPDSGAKDGVGLVEAGAEPSAGLYQINVIGTIEVIMAVIGAKEVVQVAAVGLTGVCGQSALGL